MKKYIVEFIGTFFLLLVIGNTVIPPGDAGDMAPLAIGVGLMVMIFAGGHISGAHFNPAVTLGVFLRGKCDVKDVVPYVAVQIAGAAAAAFTVMFLKGQEAMAAVEKATAAATTNVPAALTAEVLGTFALVWVILNVATAKGTEGNSFYGLAIGLTVTAMAYSLGGYSGGAFNPAVAIGISLMKLAVWKNIWIYMAANFGGGALAAVVFKIVNDKDEE